MTCFLTSKDDLVDFVEYYLSTFKEEACEDPRKIKHAGIYLSTTKQNTDTSLQRPNSTTVGMLQRICDTLHVLAVLKYLC